MDQDLFALALLTLRAELFVFFHYKAYYWTECAGRNGSVSLKNTPLFQESMVWHGLNVSLLDNGSAAKYAISDESGSFTAEV